MSVWRYFMWHLYSRLVTGVHTLTFHRCRAADPAGQYFTMNECPVGQVMNIQSAVAGYTVEYNPNANPPQCWFYSLDCTRPIDTPVTSCNGSRTCKFSQEILIYPQGSVPSLCDAQRDGNFIRIIFTCVTGTNLCNVFSYLLHIGPIVHKYAFL